MFIASPASAAATRKQYNLPNGTEFWKTDYLCVDHERIPSPNAYLIEQSPNQDVRSHFHEQPEFQLIVGGSGLLGRNKVRPVTVHYVNAYTGYGPVCSGPEGIAYVTMRPMRDNGAQFLPEERANMKRGPKKFFHSAPFTPRAAVDRAGMRESITTVECAHDDGMAHWTIACAAGQSVVAPDPALGGGQYLWLLGGEATVNGATLHANGCAFASSDEPRVTITAGAGGAEVVVLQYPRAAYTITYQSQQYRYAAQE